MTIRNIVIPKTGVEDLDIRQIWTYEPPLIHPSIPYVPVTVDIGKPIVDIPGCVEAHELNTTDEGGTKNKQLAEDDDTVTYCDAGMPSFNAMDYAPNQLIITREIPPPPVEPPPDAPEIDPPSVPKIPTDIKCPGPAQLRVGDITQSGDERVVGHRLIENGKTCETLYEPTTTVEKFLPSANQASTTAAIAIVATAAAASTPLLLRLIKPTIKKLMATAKKKLGGHHELSKSERRTNAYREKKGLPPLKFQWKRVSKK